MAVFFVIVPTLVAAIALFVIVASITRYVRLARLWRSGVKADATCLRTFVTHSSSGSGSNHHVHSTQNHVYEFRTREGQTVRFKEKGGRATVVEGDMVTIRYRSNKPSVATALPPGDGRAIAGVVFAVLIGMLMLAFTSVFFFAVLSEIPEL